MMHSDNPRLAALISHLYAGELSAHESAELTSLLESDPPAREQYVRAMNLHAELLWRYSAARKEGVAEASAAKELPTSPIAPTRRIAISARLVSLAACALLAAYFVGAVVYVSLREESTEDSLARNGLLPSPLEGEGPGVRGRAPRVDSDSGNHVATITDTADVEWSPNPSSLIPHPSAITPGEPLSITSGLVELELSQGTKLLIEGPAEWTIDGQNNATLKRGRLVAKVPQQAIGFTLETPTAKIIDLGTEFGVDVVADGKTSLHVQKGAVEVNATSDSSSKGAVRLSAGQAASISADDDRVLRVPAESVRFQIRRQSTPAATEPRPIQLANPSFEAPAVVPPLETKRPEGWALVSGLEKVDVGLQVGAAGQFLYWNEPAGSLGQFSIRGHRVTAAGITYRLKFHVAVANAGRCAVTARLLLNERIDEQCTRKFELSATPWREEELVYTTTAADVGKRVGIVFEFATLAPGVQVLLDDVMLQTQTGTPEAIK